MPHITDKSQFGKRSLPEPEGCIKCCSMRRGSVAKTQPLAESEPFLGVHKPTVRQAAIPAGFCERASPCLSL